MKLYRNGRLVEPKPVYNYSEEENDIFCMSNLRGKDIKIEKLPFSFFFSERESSHAIRVKPVFNPNKISKSSFGTLELHGDWKYTPGPDDKNVSQKQIQEMKNFFKKYKVLFAAVWEGVLPEVPLQNYFQNYIDLSELITEFDFYESYKEDMDNIDNIEQLEEFVRKYNIFNMWD